MAVTPTLLYRGQLGTTAAPGATLHTSATGTTIVTNIILSNITSTDATVTISFSDTGTTDRYILYNTTVAANSTLALDMNQVLSTTSGKLLKGRAGTATAIDAHISGVVIT